MWLVYLYPHMDSSLGICSVQFSSAALSCPTLFDPMDCSMPGFSCPSPTPGTYSISCPSSQWCHPTISSSVIPFSSCLQSFSASGSFPVSQSVLHIRWPKYWSFSFSISPSSEYSGLISFGIDWLDLLAGICYNYYNSCFQKFINTNTACFMRY